MYDLIIIGGGPGGYVCAIKAAQLGSKVALIEKENLGGTCLLRGCIPTKALLASAHVAHTIQCARDFGIYVNGYDINYEAMKIRKDQTINSLLHGLNYLVRSHGIEIFKGEASFLSNTEININNHKKISSITGKSIVIATGSKPATTSFAPVDGLHIHDSSSILDLTTLPQSITILGGGYIGCEFASLFSMLNVDVHIIEKSSKIIATQGNTLSSFLTEAFRKKRIHIQCNASVQSCSKKAHSISLLMQTGEHIESELLLVSLGRAPYTDCLNLQAIKLETDENGFIPINEKMETTVPNIYAIGDVTGKSMLAHVASHQGMIAAINSHGGSKEIHYHAVPSVIFTNPELAKVGMTLEEAIQGGYTQAHSSHFPFSSLGKAKAEGSEDGFAELVFDRETGQILGAALAGRDSGNMISAMTLAIDNELTIESISESIYPHPTLSESILEVALLAQGIPLHAPKKS